MSRTLTDVDFPQQVLWIRDPANRTKDLADAAVVSIHGRLQRSFLQVRQVQVMILSAAIGAPEAPTADLTQRGLPRETKSLSGKRLVRSGHRS